MCRRIGEYISLELFCSDFLLLLLVVVVLLLPVFCSLIHFFPPLVFFKRDSVGLEQYIRLNLCLNDLYFAAGRSDIPSLLTGCSMSIQFSSRW